MMSSTTSPTSPYADKMNNPNDGADIGQPNPNTNPFGYSTESTRRGFITKVYTLLGIQLAVIILLTVLGMLIPLGSTLSSILINISFLVLALQMALLIYISFNMDIVFKPPYNLYILGGITILFGLSIAITSVYRSVLSTSIALLVTIGLNIILTVYAIRTQRDITKLAGQKLSKVLIILVIASIIGVIVNIKVLSMVINFAILIAISFCVVYETQRIFGGKQEEISPEHYMLASLMLQFCYCVTFLSILCLVSFFGQVVMLYIISRKSVYRRRGDDDNAGNANTVDHGSAGYI